MNTKVRTALFLLFSVALLCLFGCRSRRSANSVEGVPGADNVLSETGGDVAEGLYELSFSADAGVDWGEEIQVFHYWKDILPEDYLFCSPSAEQVAAWKTECEKRNPTDSVMRSYVQECFQNMNQYGTVHDFVELWYHEDSFEADDELTLWRLEQFNRDVCIPDSEFDRFQYLKNRIQSLCLFEAGSQWELNFQAGLEADFQEFYDRVLLREAVSHSDGRVAAALLEEEEAWRSYHAALDTAFRAIDGGPLGTVGSAWPMAISGIALDDALTRAVSLEDFYFALTDKLDYAVEHKRSLIGEYEVERHVRVDERKVLEEYGDFKLFFGNEDFFDPELSYPATFLCKVLDDERKAWSAWMRSRDTVSSLLAGLCKDCYDNATNNVLRRKLIMLKNRYQGFGLSSDYILNSLLPYDCDDSQINGFSFEKHYGTN